ncbi:MAG: helix-turn-helix domain-containing protein [Gemmataceae bacterium]
MTLADFLPTPETAAAWTAVCELAEQVSADRTIDPGVLFLHGPPGSGKTHLAQGLADTAAAAGRTTELTPAADLARLPDALYGDRRCDLWILEDLQNLAARAAGTLDRILEVRLRNRKATVVTANVGPGRLKLTPRLTNRICGGLILGLDFPAVASRRALLQHLAPPGLRVQPLALDWLAKRLTSVRALQGAMQTLITLAANSPTPLDRTSVQRHWETEANLANPTPELVLKQVAAYFEIDPKVLRAKGRAPERAWPTQLAMALARKFTGYSTAELARFFDDREPRTIRHACTTVEEKIADNSAAAADWQRLVAQIGCQLEGK